MRRPVYAGGIALIASEVLTVPASVFGRNGVGEYPVQSVDGSGTAADITNVSFSGAHSDFPDVILSG
jgi:hypothetical protein